MTPEVIRPNKFCPSVLATLFQQPESRRRLSLGFSGYRIPVGILRQAKATFLMSRGQEWWFEIKTTAPLHKKSHRLT